MVEVKIQLLPFALVLLAGFTLASDCAYFFYGTGCPHCARAEPIIEELTGSGVRITSFEIYQNSSNAALLNEFFDGRGVPREKRGVPALFFSSGYLIGDRPIIENAKNLVRPDGNKNCPIPAESGNGTQITGDASSLKGMDTVALLLFVSSAALVDSINPCAIAVRIMPSKQ